MPPQDRSSPRPVRNALIAAFVALVLALYVVVLLARFDKRISDEDELADVMGAPVLARIPQAPRSRPAHASGPDDDSAFLEAFEFLRLNLQLMGPNGGNLVLAVTSPTAGDGKTTVVAWLARSLALSGAEVMAVDLDRRKRDLHRYLNADGESGNGVFPPTGEERGRRAGSTPPRTSGLVSPSSRSSAANARGSRSLAESSAAVSSPRPPCAGGSSCTHRSSPRSAPWAPARRRARSPPSRASGRPWPMSSPRPRCTRTCGW